MIVTQKRFDGVDIGLRLDLAMFANVFGICGIEKCGVLVIILSS